MRALPAATKEKATMATKTTASELSHEDVRRLLATAIRDAEPRRTSIYVSDVYPTSVVYRDWDEETSYRRDYTIGAGNSVTLGDAVEVMQRTVYENVAVMAAFSLDAGAEAAGAVPWKGPIFKAGDYPDKGLSLTTADLDAAVTAFAPVALNVEHKDSVFSGSFGDLKRIWREDDWLHGEIETPAWFRSDVVGGDRISVSTEWDLETKALVGLATALSPRVDGAEVVAVFSRGEAHFVGKRNSARDQSSVQAIHDNAAKLGAECGGNPTKKETKTMSDQAQKPSVVDRVKAFFGLLTPEERDEVAKEFTAAAPTSAPAAPPVPSAPAPVVAALSADEKTELEELRAAKATFTADRKAGIPAKAGAWADEQIAAGKATPAERDHLVALFTEAAEDDVDSPRVVTFAAGGETKQGTREERLRADFAAKSGHGLLEERVAQDGTKVLLSTEPVKKDGEVSEGRVKELLSHTTDGAAALKLVANK